jgi:hypothetical protein
MEYKLQNVDSKLALMTQSLFPALVATELLLKHWPSFLIQDHLTRLTGCFALLIASFWFYENQSTQRKWPILMIEKNTLTTRKIFVCVKMMFLQGVQNIN